MNEEQAIVNIDNYEGKLVAFKGIPYSLLNEELKDSGVKSSDTISEFTKINTFYKIYKSGAEFTTEGSNGDYVPATLRYKMAASLINKEARFLFAESPDIIINAKGSFDLISDETKRAIDDLNTFVKNVLSENNFEENLLKAAKDCFIGKRVASLVNFNEEDGITITFIPSTQFIYETKLGNLNIISKFCCFIIVQDSLSNLDKRIFKKKYELIDNKVYLEEKLYDGAGKELEVVTEMQEILLDRIPVSIFINDGLTGEEKGESDVELLTDYEKWYSKLSNSDIDAERKSMNPTKYVVDMDSHSTENLSSAAGALWDLGSDQNLDKPATQVGMLEPAMNYSAALKTSLDRIKTVGYEQIDMPNITLESLQGAITSGKSLKAIYWPLIVRCKEKMKMWGPQLKSMIDVLIKGAMLYPNCVVKYINEPLNAVDYEIDVVQNLPLPEDEAEEKNMDLAEVESNTMSRKTYMKKWRGLSDGEVEEELKQIAYERQIIEDAAFNMKEDSAPYPEVEEVIE